MLNQILPEIYKYVMYNIYEYFVFILNTNSRRYFLLASLFYILVHLILYDYREVNFLRLKSSYLSSLY